MGDRVTPDRLADLAEAVERAEARVRTAKKAVEDARRDENAANVEMLNAREAFDRALIAWTKQGAQEVGP